MQTMPRFVFDIEANSLTPDRVHMVVGQMVGGLQQAWLSPEATAALTPETIDWFGPENLFPLADLAPAWNSMLVAGTLFIGHNIIGYDLPVLLDLHGLVTPPPECLFDTAVCGRLWKPDEKADRILLLKKRIITNEDASRLHSLKTWGKRVGVFKDEAPETGWETPTDAMFRYCAQDVTTNLAVYRAQEEARLDQRAVALEAEFALVMRAMQSNGFTFDSQAASGYEAQIRSEVAEITAVLQGVVPPTVETWYIRKPGMWNRPRFEVATGIKGATKEDLCNLLGDRRENGDCENPLTWSAKARAEWWTLRRSETPFNPGSRAQVAAYLISCGWEPTEFTDNGTAKIDEETLLTAASVPHIEKLTKYFMLTKRLGQLAEGDKGWLRLVGKDGKMHGSIVTIGTVTGRCSHKNPNMGQVPSSRAPYGKEFRGLFSAREGFVLVGADASGLQLRCLGHYLARIDGGKYAKIVSEGDPHSVNQAAAGLETRALAKEFIYAWLFGAGDAKIGSIVGGDAEAGAALKARFLSGLPQLAILKEAIEETVRGRGYLLGLDGRELPIRSRHAALNTLLMACEAVLVKTATVTFFRNMTKEFGEHGKNWGLCAHVHDEFQVECLPSIAERVAEIAKEAIAASGDPYGFRCPLKGEAKIGRTWHDTH